jgi:uncharacterized membrane protein
MSRSENRLGWVVALSLVATGLPAGLFYAYACSVMPGLGGTDDRSFVDAMQQIDDAIENPVFFLTYLGAPVLLIAALVMARGSGAGELSRWPWIALALYAVTFLVTTAINIPLNNDLEQAGDPSRIKDLAAVRDDFEDPWVAWNIVRTVAVIGSFCALVQAFLVWVRGTSAEVS